MAGPKIRKAVVIGLSLAVVALSVTLGWTAAQSTIGSGAGQAAGPESKAAVAPTFSAPEASGASSSARSLAAADSAAGSTDIPAADKLIVRAASVQLRVDDVNASVRSLRSIAARHDAEIEELVVSGGDQPPVPLTEGADTPGPASASVTLRVPAARLVALRAACEKLGRVQSETASQSDVTQQHVDLSARLKNLRAEEERLRSFLDKATRVSDMLEVERELARVRGDIESMQAQVELLERQAAMSTLTVVMNEPSAVTDPGSSGWGFDAALRRGVLVTAALARALVTAAVPLLLVGIPVLAVAWIVRATARRRRMASADDARTASSSEG